MCIFFIGAYIPADPAHGKLVGSNESGDTLVVTTADIWHLYHYTNEVAGLAGVHNMAYAKTGDKLTIASGFSGHYMIVCTASLSCDSADRTVHLAVGKNGSIGTYALSEFRVKFADRVSVLTMTNLPELAVSDYLQVYFTSSNNGDVLSIKHLNLSLIYIG